MRAVVHGVRTAAGRGLPHHRADQRLRRAQPGVGARHPGPHPRPHQPHGDLPDRGRELRRPHRPLLARGCATSPARSTPSLDEGVYVQFRGPHYETPAEVQMARVLGGDLVGMSTTLEAIAARQCGLEVLGISLVTNLAAGISRPPLTTPRCSRPAATPPTAAGACSPPSSARSAATPGRARPTTAASSSRRAGVARRRPGPGDPRRARRVLRRCAEPATRRREPTSPTAFSGLLEFGTAGLRGALGAGPNRMNRAS